MKQEKAYKIKLIKILEILRQDSDEDHYIESTEILSKLATMGIECDRRTLYGDIDVLNDFGYEVLCDKSPGKPTVRARKSPTRVVPNRRSDQTTTDRKDT